MNEGISKCNKQDQEYKLCIFGCNTCKICSDEYLVQYYKNTTLLTDFDKAIHIPKVI